MSTVFTTEVQRRVRLKNAKRFDLSEHLGGESVIVYIGELPQSQQPKVVAFLGVRQELLEHGRRRMQGGESPEQAVRRIGENLETEEAAAAAAALGEQLSRRLLTVMQDLIAAAMLDQNGDRLSIDDARVLFDLLPASKEVAALIQEMSEAVLSRIGTAKPKVKPAAADDAEAPQAPPK